MGLLSQLKLEELCRLEKSGENNVEIQQEEQNGTGTEEEDKGRGYDKLRQY